MTLTREMLEKAFDELMNYVGKPTCCLCGMFSAVTDKPPLLCVVCNTNTLRHPGHLERNTRSYRCLECVKDILK